MVKEFFIDCEKLCESESAHRYLAEALEFPDYYGKNLDALFDCMTEKGECTILFKGAAELYKSSAYGAKILRVMREAATANPQLKMAVVKDESLDDDLTKK